MSLSLSLGLSARGPVASAYAPSTILANVAHAYRADLGISQADAVGRVSRWNDLVGSAHLLQTTPANQPSHNAADAGYGGLATVESTTITRWLAAAGVVSSQPVTIWVVGEFSTAGAVLVGLANASQPILYRPGGVITAYAGVGLSSGSGSTAKQAFLTTFNGASSFVGVSNWLTGGASGPSGAASGSDVSVLAYSGGTAGTVGKIAELIIQAGTPTAGEKTTMAAYFLARYGITVT